MATLKRSNEMTPIENHVLSRGENNRPDNNGFEHLALDDWITKFGRIYGKRHDKHTTEYMISRLVEEVAELVNPMEAQDKELISGNLADVFSWICSLAYKLNIDLTSLAWKKYGTNAPRHHSMTKNALSQSALSDFSQPTTLREWQIFISKLYQNENMRLTPMNALIAMMKDVGDLAMLNRKRSGQDHITSKLAAIMAWTLTISELLKLDLAEVVDQKYDGHCPVCLQTTCDTDICHPLTNMYVSFGGGTSDEEKYAVLDTATKFGYKTLVNATTAVQSTRDLSNYLDLISKSDAACVILPNDSSRELGGKAAYLQIFETLSCYSLLSKGNVWLFARGHEDFVKYLESTFSSERIVVNAYTDANNLHALFESSLNDLQGRKKSLTKTY